MMRWVKINLPHAEENHRELSSGEAAPSPAQDAAAAAPALRRWGESGRFRRAAPAAAAAERPRRCGTGRHGAGWDGTGWAAATLATPAGGSGRRRLRSRPARGSRSPARAAPPPHAAAEGRPGAHHAPPPVSGCRRAVERSPLRGCGRSACTPPGPAAGERREGVCCFGGISLARCFSWQAETRPHACPRAMPLAASGVKMVTSSSKAAQEPLRVLTN